MRCPHCKNRLLQKSGSQTRLRISGQLVFAEDGTAEAQCYWCKALVKSIPIQLSPDTPVEQERFFLKK
jgi:hypothetical protein